MLASMRLTRLCGVLGVLLAILLSAGVASAQMAPAGASWPGSRWGWPLAGAAPVVARGFAPPAQPWLPGHRGVDLLAHAGAVVRSAAPGMVHFAGEVGGVGVVSVLHAGGLLTTYEPVRPLVRAGARVRRGQPVGRLLRGSGHCAPAACLHWGLRRGTAYLDPLGLVGAGRVRLYPVHPPDGAPDAPTLPLVGAAAAGAGWVSRAGRRACPGAAGPPWCASGRSGSR
jgi:murein DD-endopeptidase MepM/ murein hydrolase activator NlpD